jgi:hypothetical protein
MGSAEQRTSGTVIVGSCMFARSYSYKLNSLADGSQSELSWASERKRFNPLLGVSRRWIAS